MLGPNAVQSLNGQSISIQQLYSVGLLFVLRTYVGEASLPRISPSSSDPVRTIAQSPTSEVWTSQLTTGDSSDLNPASRLMAWLGKRRLEGFQILAAMPTFPEDHSLESFSDFKLHAS